MRERESNLSEREGKEKMKGEQKTANLEVERWLRSCTTVMTVCRPRRKREPRQRAAASYTWSLGRVHAFSLSSPPPPFLSPPFRLFSSRWCTIRIVCSHRGPETALPILGAHLAQNATVYFSTHAEPRRSSCRTNKIRDNGQPLFRAKCGTNTRAWISLKCICIREHLPVVSVLLI